MSTPAGPNFAKWTDPYGDEYGLWDREAGEWFSDLHWLDVKRDGEFASVIEALVKLPNTDDKMLGRVVVVPGGLAVECCGQWIGRIESAQARYWGKKIAAVGGWVWGVFHLAANYDEAETHEVRYIGINKSKI